MAVQYNKVFFDYTSDRSRPDLPDPPTEDQIRLFLEPNNRACPLNRVLVSKKNEPAMHKLRTFAFTALIRYDHSCRGMNFGCYCSTGEERTYILRTFAETVGIPLVVVQSGALESTWMLFELMAQAHKDFGIPLVTTINDSTYTVPPCFVWFEEAQALSKDLRTGELLNAMEYNDGWLRAQPPGKNQRQITIDCQHICWIASSTDPRDIYSPSQEFYDRFSTHIIWQHEPLMSGQSEDSIPFSQKDLAAAGGIDQMLPLDQLRGLLTSFARAIPHHGLGDLGAFIEVQAALRIPVYRITWATLFERREIGEREAPHDGSRTFPPKLSRQTIDAWTLTLPPPSDFADGSSELPVEGSESIHGCGHCGGGGQVDCDGCQGERAVNCGYCCGAGVVICQTCYGAGRIQQIRALLHEARAGSSGLILPLL